MEYRLYAWKWSTTVCRGFAYCCANVRILRLIVTLKAVHCTKEISVDSPVVAVNIAGWAAHRRVFLAVGGRSAEFHSPEGTKLLLLPPGSYQTKELYMSLHICCTVPAL
jgi:hypothetical protein